MHICHAPGKCYIAFAYTVQRALHWVCMVRIRGIPVLNLSLRGRRHLIVYPNTLHTYIHLASRSQQQYMYTNVTSRPLPVAKEKNAKVDGGNITHIVLYTASLRTGTTRRSFPKCESFSCILLLTFASILSASLLCIMASMRQASPMLQCWSWASGTTDNVKPGVTPNDELQ